MGFPTFLLLFPLNLQKYGNFHIQTLTTVILTRHVRTVSGDCFMVNKIQKEVLLNLMAKYTRVLWVSCFLKITKLQKPCVYYISNKDVCIIADFDLYCLGSLFLQELSTDQAVVVELKLGLMSISITKIHCQTHVSAIQTFETYIKSRCSF